MLETARLITHWGFTAFSVGLSKSFPLSQAAQAHTSILISEGPHAQRSLVRSPRSPRRRPPTHTHTQRTRKISNPSASRANLDNRFSTKKIFLILTEAGIRQMAAAESSQFWSFDVSALMILVGEAEEQKYRLARRSFLESVVAAPVSGLQAYLGSYEFLLDLGSFEYFSPYGCKKAPLRNLKLENAIKKGKLLEDQQYTCFRIPASRKASQDSSLLSKDKCLLWCWVLTTWIAFVGIIIFCVLAPWTTWIGLTICLTLYTWSLILRLVEWAMVVPAFRRASDISDSCAVDAIFILGRDSSGFVLEGSRQDIKNWTSRGLVYRDCLWSLIPLRYCQWFTRIGTMALLLFIFITIPNGSTTDQVAFIVLNILGQLNTLVGLRLNARSCISRLEIAQHDINVRTRTNLYGSLIRKFKDVPDQTWIDKANLTPETPLWVKWKGEIIKDMKKDPKQLYNELCKDQSK